jgi:hypothetical protein
MPDMSLVFNAAVPNHFLITALINGTQAYTPNVNPPQHIAGFYRLLVDNGQVDFARHEFHYSGWELRGVTLSRLLPLSAGQHTVTVQWYASSGTLSASFYGDFRQIQVVEL